MILSISGVSVVKDSRNSFLLTKDQKIYAFKSYKRIFETPCLTNVKFFECFSVSCYAVVEQIGIEVKLLLYDSFVSEFGLCKCMFDLTFPQDPVTADGSRKDEKFSVEIVASVRHKKFFNELLVCNVDQESIVDVVLMAVDEKLLWVKFKGSFRDVEPGDYKIETIVVLKEKIRGLKFYEGILAILDESSILSIFYLCKVTQMIRKKELLLEGNVRCFRFHRGSIFVYSNLDKIIFIDLKNPQELTKQYVSLKGITSFTIVDHPQQFLIAINRNRMFYFVNFPSQNQRHIKKPDEFEDLEGSDIEVIPEVARFLEKSEKQLKEIEKKIKRAQAIKSLMNYLTTEKETKGGEATIKFHRNLPGTINDDAIVCNVTDQKLGCEFIEIQVELSKVFKVLNSYNIFFQRRGVNGIYNKTLKLEGHKEILHVLLPAEEDDNATNIMSLDLSIVLDIKGQTRLTMYPIPIKEVTPSNGPRVYFQDNLDTCLETIASMKM